MKYAILTVLLLGTTAASASESNKVMKWCLATSKSLSAAASCHAEYRQAVRAKRNAELRDFLKHNPRYRVPGQSLNRCWGKPREIPLESAGIETDGINMRAWVKYKDKLQANCYESAPWDNRDAKN